MVFDAVRNICSSLFAGKQNMIPFQTMFTQGPGTVRFSGEVSIHFQPTVDGKVLTVSEKATLNLYEKSAGLPTRIIVTHVSDWLGYKAQSK